MRKILLFLLFVGFFVSCSDLKEEILDETLNSDLLDGSDAADGILAPVYSRMNLLFNYHETYFLLQEISTDATSNVPPVVTWSLKNCTTPRRLARQSTLPLKLTWKHITGIQPGPGY